MNWLIVRRAVINAGGAPTDGAEKFAVSHGPSMGTGPAFADPGIVRGFAGLNAFSNTAFDANVGNCFNERGEVFQRLMFIVVRQLDEPALL